MLFGIFLKKNGNSEMSCAWVSLALTHLFCPHRHLVFRKSIYIPYASNMIQLYIFEAKNINLYSVLYYTSEISKWYKED